MTHRTFDEQIANFNRVVSSWDINQEYKVALLGMIASLGYEHEKSITPEPHWIPVTEEPIPDGEYLVTWTSEIQEKPILSIICRYSGVWDCWELQMLGHRNINVLAYMPLPEPYKGVTT